MTKFQEQFLFQKFQESYNEMPFGVPLFDDQPDVIFTTTTGKVIGIELTECIYDEVLMEESEYQIKFNEKVISQLETKMPFKFHLAVDLDNKNPLKQNQIESIIKGVIEICIQEFASLSPYESRDVEQLDVDWEKAPISIQQHFLQRGYRKLPKGIRRIQMSRFDFLERSSHSEFKSGVVPDFTAEHIDIILDKKNKAILRYKLCDEQWLVICEGCDFYSYINNVRIGQEFESKFDKIFMLRTSMSEVINIK